MHISKGIRSTLDLGTTARWTAAIRAKETERQDALIKDPWAAALAGKEGMAWIEERTEESVLPILLRTRYFDDFLQRIAAENDLRQIVLMAAGMDTRAYRLSWPENTRLYELDQPAVLQTKGEILRAVDAVPSCERVSIEVDLSGPWEEKLIQVGFVPEELSGWLLEGFLFYLPTSALSPIFDTINHLTSIGSWMGFDIVNSITLTHPLTRHWVEMQAKSGAPWLGTMDDPIGYLAGLGWSASLTQAGQEDAHHGRWPFPILPTMMPDVPHNWFVTAVKNEPHPS
jgi:methyltransferase (TIGR00027 family)